MARLHAALVALDPRYMVFQVKEKFGELRYYFGLYDPRCCTEWAAAHPAPDKEDPAAVAEDERRWQIHDASAEHQTEVDRQTAIRSLAKDLVGAAEVVSGRTCELTGGPGVLMVADTGWLKTLDPTRASNRYIEILPVMRTTSEAG